MGGHSSKSKTSYKVASSSQSSNAPAPAAAAPAPAPAPVAEAAKVVDTQTSPKAATTAPSPAPVEVDSRVVPAWLNETQFVEILRESVPKFAKIRSFKAKPGLNAGENYATLMLRVSIEVELTDKSVKPVSYMMKVPHDTPMMEAMMQAMNFFTFENEAYLELLPKLVELYKGKGLDVTLAPKAYKFTEALKQEPKLANTVLMYDLGQDGFRNLSRFEGLSMEQTKLVLRKMAQYHAAGAVFKSLYGLSETLMYGAFGKDLGKAMEIMAGFFLPAQKMFLDNLKNYEGGLQYREKLEKFFSKMMDNFVAAGPFDPNDFNVVIHGDCWVNNLLFKTGPNDELIDMVFVDFQNLRYGHPLADLLYFIFTSVNLEHKLKDFDFFLKYYHDQLIEHLQVLEYKERMPTLTDFHIQLYKYGAFAMMGTYMVLPVVLLDPTDTATLDNFISDNEAGAEFKTLMYTSKRFKQHIAQILPWLDNRGLLETIELPPAADTPKQLEEPKKLDAAAPDWVTIDYFRDLLKAEKSEFKEIKDFRVKKATEAGDNYLSVMLSVDIDYATTSGGSATTSFMLKVPTSTESLNAIIELMAPFKKEIIMYNDVIPQLEELYRQAGQPIVFGPQSYKFQKSPSSDYVLLENLRPAGFKNADRLQGLNTNETEQVLAKLAKFHAASAQLYATKGTYADSLDKPQHTEQTRPMFENPQALAFLNATIDSLDALKGSELYKDKVVSIIIYLYIYIYLYLHFSFFCLQSAALKNLFDLMVKSEVYDPSEFNCLNHGDCWTNNIMFTYGPQGEVKDTLFIDFQLSSFNTPVLDLYYFLLSSPSLDIKLEKFDYFIRFYHDELKRNLELLKYPRAIPSLRELHNLLLKHSFWALKTISSVTSIVLLDPTDNASLDNIVGDNAEGLAFKKKLFQNERYRKHAEAVYTWLNYRGQLDFE
ncbi:hypothetical protein KR222_001855 [Zaprionus bogoriensis]|nr:hypothetical protein KR222_001855 [Zaprionus bogoriensis]